MTSFLLKLIALVTMTIDHIGYFFPDTTFRIIGRISFPIYCFLLAEGFRRTKSRAKYFLRLLVFAVLTEPIYDFAFHKKWFASSGQNVLFELALGFAAIWLLEALKKLKKPLRIPLSALVCVASVCLGSLAELDYGWFGIGTILLFYAFPIGEEGEKKNRIPLALSLILWNTLRLSFVTLLPKYGINVTSIPVLKDIITLGSKRWEGIKTFALFSLLPLFLYDGTRGGFSKEKHPILATVSKYFFYFYYPLHLLVIVWIRRS